MPNKCFFFGVHGEIFATRNFSDPFPVWRKYKRLGWALRYLYRV